MLVSNYTIAQFKPYKSICHEAPIKNELDRQFVQEEQIAVVIRELTHVRVGSKWHYVYLFVDLYNREIVGHSARPNKTARLIYRSISSIRVNLNDVKMFNTDRGKEFDNRLISIVLSTFSITRSLSKKRYPYDYSVAEAMFKVFKTEFTNGAYFLILEQLNIELHDYVHWLNNIQIHMTLGYLTPIKFKQLAL